MPCVSIEVVGQPSFSITDVRASKTSVQINEEFTVTATIANNGSAGGTANVNLLVNGTVKGGDSVYIDAGSSANVSFTLSFSSPGSYNVCVELA